MAPVPACLDGGRFLNDVTFPRLVSWENLFLAWLKASQGKRQKAEIALFEYHLEENLLSLQADLLAQRWKPSGYRSFFIHDPKRRLISAAPFPDRVVHHALCNIIEPIFEKSFVQDSYANRNGKGNHRALDAVQKYASRFPYVMSLDVNKFFPGIDHQVLYQLLTRKISDQAILHLIHQILESGVGVLEREADNAPFPGDSLIDKMRPKGLPIGNLTSQFWANVYMNPLDHFIKRTLQCKAYVRFVDDLLLFAGDKRTLWLWKQELTEYLVSMRLHFHEGAHPRPVSEGFGFLGFQIFSDRKRLKKRKGIQYQRHLKILLENYYAGLVGMDEVLDSVMAWNNHLSYGNTMGLRKNIFAVLPRRMALEAKTRFRQSLMRKRARICKTMI
jgi:Reverse transcriptase (RNA-dependent DNA polymerase)